MPVQQRRTKCNRVYCVCFGLWPSNLFFPILFLFDWVGVLWLELSIVLKLVRWARRVLFPPSVPAVAGRQLVIVRAVTYVSDSGESLHCFLVGTNKSYVITTSDLWLFIHASNLLPWFNPLQVYRVFIYSALIKQDTMTTFWSILN